MENKNALIADFMGWDFHKGFFIHRDAKCIDGANMMRPEELHYHDDWNWLMAVVEKCHKVGKEKEREFPDPKSKKDLDDPTGWRAWSYRYVHLYTNIEIVYASVVKFVEFYNLQIQ